MKTHSRDFSVNTRKQPTFTPSLTTARMVDTSPGIPGSVRSVGKRLLEVKSDG